MSRPTQLLPALAVLVAAGCSQPASNVTPLNQRAVGSWSSITCERSMAPGSLTVYRKRHVTFTQATYDMSIEYYDDVSCTAPGMSVHIAGSYTVATPEENMMLVAGPGQAELQISTLQMTPHLPRYASYLNEMHCGTGNWSPEVVQDVANTGCFGYGPAATCSTEYDLLDVDGDTMHFGQRPTSGQALCTADLRPTSLETYGLAKDH
jgi:hypothetical protein